MIETKDVKVTIPKDLSSIYIEQKLNEMGLDVLRWAITGIDSENYIVNVSYIK